jgi:hypothetical protein
LLPAVVLVLWLLLGFPRPRRPMLPRLVMDSRFCAGGGGTGNLQMQQPLRWLPLSCLFSTSAARHTGQGRHPASWTHFRRLLSFPQKTPAAADHLRRELALPHARTPSPGLALLTSFFSASHRTSCPFVTFPRAKFRSSFEASGLLQERSKATAPFCLSRQYTSSSFSRKADFESHSTARNLIPTTTSTHRLYPPHTHTRTHARSCRWYVREDVHTLPWHDAESCRMTKPRPVVGVS